MLTHLSGFWGIAGAVTRLRPSSGRKRVDGWHWRENEEERQTGEGCGNRGREDNEPLTETYLQEPKLVTLRVN